MTLPFTDQQFLDVLGAYNRAWWPAILLSWGLAVAVLVAVIRGSRRPLLMLLFVAALWFWSGVVYHAMFFTRINPAAWIFAGMFVFEAACLTWVVVKQPSIHFDVAGTWRGRIAAALLIYAVLYPFLVWLSGHELSRGPVFAVPCPTALFTAGILLAVRPAVSRWLYVVPVAWSVIAGSAAILFGIAPDFALFAAAAAMAVDALIVFRPSRAPSVA